MKVAILGAGSIARTMASTIREMKDVDLYAIAARDLSRAKTFAEEFGFARAYGSYEEMAADPSVGLVYIATPMSHHYAHAKLSLEHGKNVLCEKAFTVNAAQAEDLVKLAREKKLLLAEAIWTRYMPSRQMIDDLLADGVIGNPTSLTANLGFVLDTVPRMKEPSLAGGALLDLGVYPINFASMVFGTQVREITSACVKSEKGVDLSNSITLLYEDGKMAVLHSSMISCTDRKGVVYGDKGYMEVHNINNCEEICIFDADTKLVKRYEAPPRISGYEYEVQACKEAIEKGMTECPQMPHSEIIRIMRLMDQARAQWDMQFPCE